MTNLTDKNYNEKKAAADFDAYNTVVKTHTINNAGQKMTVDEVASGHIKINGTEQFSSFAEMKDCLHPEAKITTVEL